MTNSNGKLKIKSITLDSYDDPKKATFKSGNKNVKDIYRVFVKDKNTDISWDDDLDKCKLIENNNVCFELLQNALLKFLGMKGKLYPESSNSIAETYEARVVLDVLRFIPLKTENGRDVVIAQEVKDGKKITTEGYNALDFVISVSPKSSAVISIPKTISDIIQNNNYKYKQRELCFCEVKKVKNYHDDDYAKDICRLAQIKDNLSHAVCCFIYFDENEIYVIDVNYKSKSEQ